MSDELDPETRERLLTILRPIYQDLDGVSRQDAFERVARLARSLTEPTRDLELLLLFYPAATWIEKAGNLSRVTLAGGISEAEIRATMGSIRRLSLPQTNEERAVAAALLIDSSGVRGLAEAFGRARREGRSPADVALEAIAENTIPEWMSDEAAALLEGRIEARRKVCEELLREMNVSSRA
jgi:hypothetical protein